MVLDWAFTHLEFTTLYSYTKSTNIPSIATAASVGMVKEKEYIDPSGEPTYVSLIPRDKWRTEKAKA